MADEQNFGTIKGDPMPLQDLLDLAVITDTDLESASAWWDKHATRGWVGALNAEPTEENVIADDSE